MTRKKSHMTKHEYGVHNTKYRYAHSLDIEGEGNRSVKATYAKYRKKSDAEMKKHLRSIQRYSDGILDEEYEEYSDI